MKKYILLFSFFLSFTTYSQSKIERYVGYNMSNVIYVTIQSDTLLIDVIYGEKFSMYFYSDTIKNYSKSTNEYVGKYVTLTNEGKTIIARFPFMNFDGKIESQNIRTAELKKMRKDKYNYYNMDKIECEFNRIDEAYIETLPDTLKPEAKRIDMDLHTLYFKDIDWLTIKYLDLLPKIKQFESELQEKLKLIK